MLVPEASMHKDCLLAGGKDYIGTAGEILAMQPEAIPEPMRERTNNQLRLGIFASDTPHVLAAALFAYLVHVGFLLQPWQARLHEAIEKLIRHSFDFAAPQSSFSSSIAE